MRARLPRRSLLGMTIVIAALVLVAGLFVEVNEHAETGSSSTAVSTRVQTVTYQGETYFYTAGVEYVISLPVARSNVTNGIQLVLNLTFGVFENRTVILAHSAIDNTLAAAVMLSSGEFDADQPCGGQATSRVEVYAGFYIAGNITGTPGLYLFDPHGLYGCPAFQQASSYNYTFHPGLNDVESETIEGYWSGVQGGQLENQQFVFHDFAPGRYTVVASDPWGQYAIGYFESN